MSELPPWCTVPSPFVGRTRVVEKALAAAEMGPVTMVGPPGAGTTTTGGAVLARALELGRIGEIIAVRVDGCTNISDLMRDMGIALGLMLPGDAATVRRRLRSAPRVGVLIDDADLAADTAQQVLAIAGPSLLVATGREGVLGTPVAVDPLTDEQIAPLARAGQAPAELRGLPLLGRLPAPADPVDPWSTTQKIPGGSELLADVPMGLDDEGVDPGPELSPYLLPVVGRMVFRRAVRETLGAGHRPSADTLREVVRDRQVELHRIAADADPYLSSADIVLLRTAAEQIQEPPQRALAAAAAARMMIRMFQPHDAIALTQVVLAIRLPPLPTALLRWVQGDAQLAVGNLVEAQAAWREAERALRSVDRRDVLGALARSAVSRLAVRQRHELCEPWMAVLHELRAGRGDPSARADALRVLADVAQVRGDAQAARESYTVARTALDAVGGSATTEVIVDLSTAMARIEAGELNAAEMIVERCQERAHGHPHLRATCDTLRAEVQLRRGKPEKAQRAAERAAERWRWTGSHRGLGTAYRILGDSRALLGDRTGAIAQWREAVRIGVRAHDRYLTETSLHRIAVVEQLEGVGGPHVDEAVKQHELARGLA